MQHFLRALFTIYITTHFSIIIASEIGKVTPDFIKMRHSAEVKVDIKDAIENLQLSLVPGGAFIKQTKTVNLSKHLDKAENTQSCIQNNEIFSQQLAFNKLCITLSNKNGIQVWEKEKNQLHVISQFQTNNIPREVILFDNTLVIANGTTGITILGINNTGQLNWKGSYNKLGNIIHVAYANQHLLAADDKGVLTLFDIANPAIPLLISDFHTHQQIQSVQLFKKQASVITKNRILTVDFSSHSSPLISTLGVNQGGSRRSTIDNDILYVADWFSGLHLYDIRIPAAPRLLSSFHTPGSPKGVVVKDGIAFVADDDHGLQIIDVSDVRNPKFIAEIPLSGLAYTMKLIDNLLYIASHRGGFHIVDVSKPAQPKLISTVDTAGKSWALEYQNGLLYVADDDSGLLIYDVTNPALPKLINQFNPGGFAEDIVIKNNKAYIAFFDLGLFILDISKPTKLKQLAHLTTPGNARGIEIVDDLLYLASWEAGVLIIDVSSNLKPTIIGHYDTKGAAWGLSIQNKLVYVMDWWGGIKILDAKDATKPTLISQYQTAGIINDLIFHDQFIYTAQGSRGLQIYDASNDLNPVWATGVDIAGTAVGLTINQELVILAVADGGIAIVDISNPFQAKLIGQLKLDTEITFVQSQNNFVFAAAKNGDLFLIDITNSSTPQLVKRLRSKVTAIDISDHTLFVLDDYQTLATYSVKNMSKIERFQLPIKTHNFTLIDNTHFILQGDKQLLSCSILKNSITCKNPVSLQASPIALHVAKNNLYVTMKNNSLIIFHIEQDKYLTLNTIYPSSHNITAISTSNNGIFFGGESKIASSKHLPTLDISRENDHFIIQIPKNMPKGAYDLVLSYNNDGQSISKNAITIGFPKLKSKFTLEQLKAIMKQKNFAGKAP